VTTSQTHPTRRAGTSWREPGTFLDGDSTVARTHPLRERPKVEADPVLDGYLALWRADRLRFLTLPSAVQDRVLLYTEEREWDADHAGTAA
jgi:hypothetical protein